MRLTKALAFVLISFLFTACENETKENSLRIVSWGGNFQKDLMDEWVKPAAERCEISVSDSTWNGDYASLTRNIDNRVNVWDLVHVEDYYVNHSRKNELFISKIVPSEIPELNQNSHAAPILQYGYIMAYNKKFNDSQDSLGWKEFFDTQNYPGSRALRDFPVGNVEIALYALGGKGLIEKLYSSKSSPETKKMVGRSLDLINKLKQENSIYWWKTGNQLQSMIEGQQVDMIAAWTGRLGSAYENICLDQACPFSWNSEQSLVSTDWWVSPANSTNSELVKNLIKCLYSEESNDGAISFSRLQKYSTYFGAPNGTVPTELMDILNAGTANMKLENNLAISNKFWSENYNWIKPKWDILVLN